MTLKHAFVSAAGADPDPTVVDGPDWNADHVVDADGMAMVGSTAVPAASIAGRIKLWARNIAGRIMPSFVDERGASITLQPHLGRNRVYAWMPQGFNSSIATVGGTANLGAPVSRAVDGSSFFTSIKRAGYVTAATANANISARGYGPAWVFSSVAKAGGFHNMWRFGTCNYAADGRVFLGMGSANASYGAVSPSSMTNIVGIGYDPGDVVWSIYHNDGSGTATKIPTGFACNTTNTDVYEVAIFAAPGTQEFSYIVTRLNDGSTFPADAAINGPGKATTDIPTQVLQPHLNVTNGVSAALAGVDFMGQYVDSEF